MTSPFVSIVTSKAVARFETSAEFLFRRAGKARIAHVVKPRLIMHS